jgi:hypothetical protein
VGYLTQQSQEEGIYKFKEVAGKTLGVDVSVWLHQSCSLEEIAFCFHAHPRYPPSKVLTEVKRCH